LRTVNGDLPTTSIRTIDGTSRKDDGVPTELV